MQGEQSAKRKELTGCRRIATVGRPNLDSVVRLQHPLPVVHLAAREDADDRLRHAAVRHVQHEQHEAHDALPELPDAPPPRHRRLHERLLQFLPVQVVRVLADLVEAAVAEEREALCDCEVHPPENHDEGAACVVGVWDEG